MLAGLRLALALILAGALAAAPATAATVARLDVEEVTLLNGMRLLLVERPQASTVSAGWVARVGSASEGPGESGLSHFIEHLLFKGTRTVGARQLEVELLMITELDGVMRELSKLRAKPSPSGKQRKKLEELEARREQLEQLTRQASVLGEFSLLYSSAGATGLNANTLEDLTMFYVTVPAEKLELWFWLESDRLLEPVFREFHKEKRVIAEERRMRVGSTPTGELDEAFRRAFWGSLPYSWLPLGSQPDVDAATRTAVTDFFERHYSAPNLTAVLVGRFDKRSAINLAKRYFGRLPAARPPKSRQPFEPPTPSQEPLADSCDCTPQAQLRYPSVGFGHPDSFRLQVVAGLLNGRTGRLYRSMVLDQQLAQSASVLQHPLRRAGSFLFTAEARSGTDPERLVDAWGAELAKLVEQPLDATELAKVKAQITSDSYRRLKDSEALMRQLLIYDGLGDWRHLHRWPEQILAVEPTEVVDAARRYLVEGRPATALYRRSGAEPEAIQGAAPR